MEPIKEILDSDVSSQESINVNHENDEELTVDNEGYIAEKFYKTVIFDGKEFTKLAKSVEKLIRTSEEYKSFIYYIFNDLNIKECSILGNVGEEDDLVKIEIDHYPFTLFDIVSAVMNKYIDNKLKFNTFSIADEVMKLHYDMKVGIVPLSVTMHQLRHSGKLFVNLKQVVGNYIEFAKEYQEFIDPDTMATFAKLMEMSRDNLPISSDPNFLQVKHQEFYTEALPAPNLELGERNETTD